MVLQKNRKGGITRSLLTVLYCVNMYWTLWLWQYICIYYIGIELTVFTFFICNQTLLQTNLFKWFRYTKFCIYIIFDKYLLEHFPLFFTVFLSLLQCFQLPNTHIIVLNFIHISTEYTNYLMPKWIFDCNHEFVIEFFSFAYNKHTFHVERLMWSTCTVQ